MKHRWIIACSLGLLLAPLPLAAQQRGGQGEGPQLAEIMRAMRVGLTMLDQGSVQFLLTKGSELQLTADQRAKMGALASRWSQATKASRDTIRANLQNEAPAMRSAQPQQMQGRLQQLMPHAMLLLQEDRKSLEETFKLLEPPQQAKAKALIETRLNALAPQRSGGPRS